MRSVRWKWGVWLLLVLSVSAIGITWATNPCGLKKRLRYAGPNHTDITFREVFAAQGHIAGLQTGRHEYHSSDCVKIVVQYTVFPSVEGAHREIEKKLEGFTVVAQERRGDKANPLRGYRTIAVGDGQPTRTVIAFQVGRTVQFIESDSLVHALTYERIRVHLPPVLSE